MKWNSYVRLLEETQGYESTGWSEQGEGGVVRESKMERERALKMAQKMMWSSQGVCAELIGGDWKEEKWWTGTKARLKDKMRKKVKYNKEGVECLKWQFFWLVPMPLLSCALCPAFCLTTYGQAASLTFSIQSKSFGTDISKKINAYLLYGTLCPSCVYRKDERKNKKQRRTLGRLYRMKTHFSDAPPPHTHPLLMKRLT